MPNNHRSVTSRIPQHSRCHIIQRGGGGASRKPLVRRARRALSTSPATASAQPPPAASPAASDRVLQAACSPSPSSLPPHRFIPSQWRGARRKPSSCSRGGEHRREKPGRVARHGAPPGAGRGAEGSGSAPTEEPRGRRGRHLPRGEEH